MTPKRFLAEHVMMGLWQWWKVFTQIPFFEVFVLDFHFYVFIFTTLHFREAYCTVYRTKIQCL